MGEVAEKFDNLRIPITAAKRKKGVTPYYGANGIQDYVEGYTHNGEFVLVAEDGANDLQNYPVHYVSGKIWVNNHAHVLQGKNRIADNLFLLNAIKKIQFETYLVGGSRAKLNADTMMKLPIKLPGFKEQQELGKYFYKLDNLIALHQRKLNKLKKMKSACLTEMFPAEGEREPKRRFPGFTGAWEQRKLGETSKITAGGDVDKEKLLTHGKYPVIANALTNDGIVGYYNDAYRITAPAVTVTGRGEIGKAKSRKINFTPVVRLLSVESKHNVDFLAEAINRSKVVFESTGVPQLTVPKLSNYKISFPVSENEETKIGDFIQQFDSLIALHQRKLDKIKKMKLAYLNELFV